MGAVEVFGSHAIDMAEVVAISHVKNYKFQLFVRGVPQPFDYQYDEDFAVRCNHTAEDILQKLRKKMLEQRRIT